MIVYMIIIWMTLGTPAAATTGCQDCGKIINKTVRGWSSQENVLKVFV